MLDVLGASLNVACKEVGKWIIFPQDMREGNGLKLSNGKVYLQELAKQERIKDMEYIV